ncbi:CBS domain-containing protein [Paenibacillus shirakamiensis]|uniref:CBS domain-containing protein n=1 Tax=Paenibacillus shirakamiensis TaxID=1265935 RepID=A0ABS4JHT2_9BACL|nr:DUF294 nucleotidyltransferase-like domain-containing protein [Paenibacillus shirakamiensis]MBP2001278.1 CBS domain-containing protein [Paenibacillus shirakamiensis]
MSEVTVKDIHYTGIRSASSPRSLRAARMKEQNELLKLRNRMPVLEWNRAVNQMHDEVMNRAVYLSEMMMEAEGFGQPPTSYAFVVFGSAGRSEQTLWSDQDNGLIIGDSGGRDLAPYFDVFAERLVRILEKSGYPPCPGQVMAINPMWRKDIAGWRQQLQGWRNSLQWEAVRYLTIASDLRHIAGDAMLSAAWSDHFLRIMEQSDELTAGLLRNTVRHKAGLNVLGQVITESFGEHAGSFDMKYGLYMPLVNGIRCMALQYGLRETSTLDRLQKLIQLEAVSGIEACQSSFVTALQLRSMTSWVKEDGMIEGSSYLSPTIMRQRETLRLLRGSLGNIKMLYRTLQRQHRFWERKRK